MAKTCKAGRRRKHGSTRRRGGCGLQQMMMGGCGLQMMRGGSAEGGATGFMKNLVGDMGTQFNRTMDSSIGNPAFQNGTALGSIQNPNIGYPSISKPIANIQGGGRRRRRGSCRHCQKFHRKGHRCGYCGGMGIIAQALPSVILGTGALWQKRRMSRSGRRHTKRRR